MQQLPNSQEQIEAENELTFRDIVDMCIVFVCIPALILSAIFVAIATAFSHAGVLPNIMALIVTLLLSLVGGILIVRYVDVCLINLQKYNASPSDDYMPSIMGSGAVCIFLAACIVGSLSVAGSIGNWQYALMPAEILLVGYQTWRTFISRNK